jgi:hypothetical protein
MSEEVESAWYLVVDGNDPPRCYADYEWIHEELFITKKGKCILIQERLSESNKYTAKEIIEKLFDIDLTLEEARKREIKHSDGTRSIYINGEDFYKLTVGPVKKEEAQEFLCTMYAESISEEERNKALDEYNYEEAARKFKEQRMESRINAFCYAAKMYGKMLEVVKNCNQTDIENVLREYAEKAENNPDKISELSDDLEQKYEALDRELDELRDADYNTWSKKYEALHCFLTYKAEKLYRMIKDYKELTDALTNKWPKTIWEKVEKDIYLDKLWNSCAKEFEGKSDDYIAEKFSEVAEAFEECKAITAENYKYYPTVVLLVANYCDEYKNRILQQ